MSEENSSGFKWWLIIGGVLFAIFALYRLVMWVMGIFIIFGYNTFFYLDNLIGVTPFNPIITWSIWGMFLGGIVGVIVAVKKLKLSKILILYPTAALLLLIIIFGFVNHPANYNGNYQPPVEKTIVTPTKNYYTVIMDANVRSGPSKSSGILFVVTKGSVVEVIQQGFFDSRNLEWYWIRNGSDQGYISAKLLTFSHSQ